MAAIGVEFEAEGRVGILVPECGGALADIGVERWIGRPGAPEFVDGGAEDGAGDKEAGGMDGVRVSWETKDGEGRLILGGVWK